MTGHGQARVIQALEFPVVGDPVTDELAEPDQDGR
jgi:hypothetical protein